MHNDNTFSALFQAHEQLFFASPTVATLVHILPTTWAMEAMTDLSMRGLGLVAVIPEIAILLGYAVIFFVIGARRFKWE